MSVLSTLAIARAGLAAFAAMGVVWGTYAAVLPDIKTMLGVDEAELGLIMFFTPAASVSAMLLAPRIGAALGRHALPVVALAMALAIALPGQASAIWMFPLAMMCCGATTGVTDVLMNARVAALENDRRLHLMNLCHALYSFGYAAGAIGTGLLRDLHWSPGQVTGTMSLLALLIALGTFEADGTIRGLMRPRNSKAAHLGLVPLIGGAIVFIAFVTENAAETWSALHIEKTLGGSPAQGAMGPATLALTMGVARLAGNGLAGRHGAPAVLTTGAIIAALGALIAAVALGPISAYFGFIVMGIGASVIAPTAFSLVGRAANPEARGRAVARATLLGYFGYFFGPPAMGFAAGHFGLRMAFVAAALLVLAVPVLAALVARRIR